MNINKLWFAIVLAISCTVNGVIMAQEVSIAEEFALAEDREKVLSQLIPGTEEYFYYHALHYQNTEQLAKVDQLLKTWVGRHGETNLVIQIKNRQAILKYATDPKSSLDYISKLLSLRFDHQREIPQAERSLPSKLDDRLIAESTLIKRALGRKDSISGFEKSGLLLISDHDLNKNQLRSYLQQLEYPDIANLPILIAKDLATQDAPQFGSYLIHQNLTQQQLDELEKLRPELLNQQQFIDIYLMRLRPSDDIAWSEDTTEMKAYLQRLAEFVERLGSTHNSLKANILHRQLKLNLKLGIYDKELFVKYLQLPRNVSYINPEYLKTIRQSQSIADLNQNFQDRIAIPPVLSDEQVIREHLLHLFVKATDFSEFLRWIRDDYLKKLFAEAKIVNGLGENEKWASMLSPEEYKALLERVDLDFALTNSDKHEVNQTVEVELFTKNVSKLIVKVFEINAENYYRQFQREIDTDINLDGLVANWEETYSYEETPLRRVKRKFKFDQMNKPGVYVVDFIGNGKSSRALIRKGKLHHLVETNFAGHLFAIFNEADELIKDAFIWMGGRRYDAGENGMVLIPFSTQPRRQPIILGGNGMSALEFFSHQAENYSLRTGIVVDRESLIRGEKARVILRPQLLINGMPTSLKSLEKIRLNITTTSLDGVAATQDFPDIKLNEGFETSVEFQVPDRMQNISFSLTATIKNISQVAEQQLSASDSYAINEIDRTPNISDVHFVDGDNGFRLEVRGKSGEPQFRQAVLVALKHRDFTETVQTTLQTDDGGKIELGSLEGIEWISGRLSSNVTQTWQIPRANNDHYDSIHGIVGEAIEIPVAYVADNISPNEFALFEKRGGKIVNDRFEAISLKAGLITLNGLNAGDYEFLNKKSNAAIRIRITEGERVLNYAFGEHRNLELRSGKQTHINSISHNDDSVSIKLDDVTVGTRVHVIATRQVPRFQVFPEFSAIADAEPTLVHRAIRPSVYIAGRNIGDELRYILDRQYAQKYAGNMLTRPTLLLNPWALRDTESTVHSPEEGDDFSESNMSRDSGSARGERGRQEANAKTDFSSLDFLSNPSSVHLNFKPDENGTVKIDRADLGDKHYLQIIVDDPFHTAVRQLKLPESNLELRDLRLVEGLDPTQHFTQSKEHSILAEGEEFVLVDPLSGKFQQFDDLGDVFRLFAAKTGDETLNEFSFILEWLNKTDDEKKELYSKFACHELHLFLKFKDPKFFGEVITPYLQNKRDKTFMDHWLLDQSLEHYANGWQFEQLNTTEQILLSLAIKDLRTSMIQLIDDRYNLSPTDVTRADENFGYIFASGGLDGKDIAGQMEKKVSETRRLRSESGSIVDSLQPQNQPAPSTIAGRSFGTDPAKPGEDARLGRKNYSADKMEADDEISEAEEISEEQLGLAFESKNLGEGFGDDENGKGKRREMLREQLKSLEQLYRRLKPTQEWVENNYYHLPITQHTADRVPINRFWRDYANHVDGETFLSPYFAEATSNFTEMMLALAVLDLPFEAPEHKVEITDEEMKFEPGGRLVAFYQQIKPALFERRGSTILISENFFRNDDRYRQEADQRYDKFVTDEFLTNVLYGGQVVITNPTSTPQTIELLIQIPEGALPVAGTQMTKSTKMNLAAFSTQTAEYFFYFPVSGDYSHFPAHVSSNDRVIAVAEGLTFKVLDTPSKVDRSSWTFISQNGTDEEVIEFLQTENILAVDLNRIAFRMKDEKFFVETTKILKKRFAYSPLLWSYSVHHNDTNRLREFMSRNDAILNQMGWHIESPILSIEPVNRRWYEHREFWPLVNARAHQLGGRNRILNSAIHQQYHRLLNYLIARTKLDSYDQLAVVYYLLLQDRVSEAIEHFEKIDAKQLESRMQYDYCQAYLAMYQEQPAKAAEIAKQYIQHPVKRWRDMYANIVEQVAEIETGVATAVDAEDQLQSQTELASKTPSFEFEVEGGKIQLKYQNLEKVTVSYYLMDIELLFSRNPFVQQQSGGFSYIRPNTQEVITLTKGNTLQEIEIPGSLDNRNVLVEVADGNTSKSKAYYANALQVQVIENYGQLRVTLAKTNSPVSKAYVKVYAMKADGSVHFYKDGYTDLRGRFDYASLSNQNLDDVTRFSMLILSEDHGAVVREATVPKE